MVTKNEFIESLQPLTCSLCLEPYDSNHVPVEIPNCGHVFGHHCITNAFKAKTPNNNRCPLCRDDLFVQEDFRVRVNTPLNGERIDHDSERPDSEEEGSHSGDTDMESADESEDSESEDEQLEYSSDAAEDNVDMVGASMNLHVRASHVNPFASEDEDADDSDSEDDLLSEYDPDSEDEREERRQVKIHPAELKGLRSELNEAVQGV